MGLLVLIAGLIVLLGAHIFVTFRDARARLIAQLGRNGYRALFSVVAIVGLALVVWGYGEYRAHESSSLWSPPRYMRHITAGLMLFAVVFMTAAIPLASHIRMTLKHPMLASVKTWALAHLLSNGDLGSIVLFGSFLAWGVYARIAAKRRGDMGATAAPAGWMNDIIVIVIGVAVYLALGLWFHPYVIGVTVFGK